MAVALLQSPPSCRGWRSCSPTDPTTHPMGKYPVRTRCRTVLAELLAEALRAAGLQADADVSTVRDYMTKVRVCLDDVDCGFICVYDGRDGVK